MAGYKEIFPNPHTVLPVIHVETPRQTLQNAEIARKEGADGAFLISMKEMPYWMLADLYQQINTEMGSWWIGVNYLDLPIEKTFPHLKGISGVWTDNARIDERVDVQEGAQIVDDARKQSEWDGIYFGGVAMKYQRPVKDVGRAAKIATEFVDVVTTSGIATGSEPEIDKIKTMKQAIGTHPLAISSGISPENVHNYLEIADCFLVATSLLEPGREVFVPSRMRDLVQAVRS